MSDLRQRLERRSERFELEPGALDRTLDRGLRIQRRRRIGAGLVALAIGVAGTIAVTTSMHGVNVATDRVSPTSRPMTTIPDGVYWTPRISRGDILSTLQDEGYTRKQAERWYFSNTLSFDHWIRQGLVIQDGFWIQTAQVDTGQQEVGWSGTYRISGPGEIEAGDTDCTNTYRFTLSEDTLALRILSDEGPPPMCGPRDMIAQTAIFDVAPFIRT
jgi:hypothetical protein